MRFLVSRGPCAAVLLLGAVAGAAAQPPTTVDKLKADTAALAAERAGAESAGAERARLQSDLRKLLERLEKQPPPSPMTQPAPVPPPVGKKDGGPTITALPVDRLREAINLVQSNQIEAALRAFRLIPPQELDAEDRAFVRFMTASCLRRLGRPADALPIYREVGDAGEEPFIASSATSQVGLLRTAEDLQAQLLKLRERPKTR